MKTTKWIAAGLMILATVVNGIGHAQGTADSFCSINLGAISEQTGVLPLSGSNFMMLRSCSDVQLTALAGVLGEVPTIPFVDLPKNRRGQTMGGTFWSLQEMAPLPSDPAGVDVWQMADGSYLLNDLNYNYDALSASPMGMHPMDSGGSTLPGFGDNGGTYAPYGLANTRPDYGTNLWLAITSATNGVLSLVLSNTVFTGTGEIYAIMDTLALPSANWNIVTQVWAAADQNWIAFTVPASSPTNLFLWAEDWTDLTTNGLPCWWEFFWYGNLTNTVSSSGNPLLTDYQNYTNGITPCDPNVISFTVSATNLYVSTEIVPVTINLQAGIPYYVAVLVNDTNYADAVWQPYTGTNLLVTLDGADGVYDVWVGLKGLPAAATVTWDTDDLDFTLDRVAPTMGITSPALANGAATVSKPYLQIQGWAGKPLASLSYDIRNALGAVSSVAGNVTDVAGYDPVYCKYMTNFFQCYDVPLATNDNFITLRVTDVAGNTTTTNFDVVLDYTGATNPPVVKVLWPQDGMAVSGTNITVRGTMSDETGTIQAQIVDASGNTNVITGLVERNGMFWLENVPLNGTSQISLQTMDAAGNATTNNITIMPSALTLTINSTPTGDDLYQPSGTVTGTVGDPDAVVTVNGQTATVDDSYANDDGTYNWSADQVPIYGMGTATFDASATPATGSGLGMARARDDDSGSGAANTSLAVEMGPMLTVTHYNFTEANSEEAPLFTIAVTRTMTYDGKYAPDANGQWRQTYQATETEIARSSEFGVFTNAQTWSDPEPFYPVGFYGVDVDVDTTAYGFWVVHNFAKAVHHHWDYVNGDGLRTYSDVTVNADTHWTLYTGGKAVINGQGQAAANATSGGGPQDLFAIYVTANSYEDSPYGPEWYDAPINGVAGSGIQAFGQTFWSDYTLCTMQSANAAVDANLHVNGVNDASAGLAPPAQPLAHTTQYPALTDANRARLNLGVGECVNFTDLPDTQWTATGGGFTTTNGAGTMFTAPSNALPDGIAVTVTATSHGTPVPTTFKVFPPTGYDPTNTSIYETATAGYGYLTNQEAAGMLVSVCIAPTTVSFYRVQIKEIAGPGTNGWGYFAQTAWNSPPIPDHSPNRNFVQLDSNNYWGGASQNHDNCYYEVFTPGIILPAGGFTYDIPVAWQIDPSTTNGVWHWSQVTSFDASGTVSVTKYQKTVTRTINNIWAPSL